MRKHFMIPDLQVTPDTPIDHLEWISKYILEKRPDVIVQIGDWADMESLSSYDIGKKCYEGRRVKKDIKACVRSLNKFHGPIHALNKKLKKWKMKLYRPEMHITLGNHENRINRAVEDDPKLDGFLSVKDLCFEEYGWQVHDFLKPIEVDGIMYAHYFYNPLSGRPYGGTSIDTRLKNIGFSFVQGHQQVYMVGTRPLNNGDMIRGLICGNCYLHDEDYRGYQANAEFRGIFVLHEVVNGNYSLMEVSLDYLCNRYEGMPLWKYMKKNHRGIFDESQWLQRLAT